MTSWDEKKFRELLTQYAASVAFYWKSNDPVYEMAIADGERLLIEFVDKLVNDSCDLVAGRWSKDGGECDY